MVTDAETETERERVKARAMVEKYSTKPVISPASLCREQRSRAARILRSTRIVLDGLHRHVGGGVADMGQ